MKGLLTIIIIIAVIIVLVLLSRGSDTPDDTDISPTPTAEPTGEATADPTPEISEEENDDTHNDTPTENESESTVVEFNVTGKNFEFSMSEIRVNKGDTVRINFQSTAGNHDWVVDQFDARTQIVSSGGTTSVEFVADQTGTFEYYCSVGNHRALGMVGNLIVQ